MTENNIKTVPVYHDNCIIGSAVVETIKNAKLKDDRTTDAWTISNISINIGFEQILINHGYMMYTVIDFEKFEGIALTLGYPKKEFVINTKNKIVPITLNRDEIGFEE